MSQVVASKTRLLLETLWCQTSDEKRWLMETQWPTSLRFDVGAEVESSGVRENSAWLRNSGESHYAAFNAGSNRSWRTSWLLRPILLQMRSIRRMPFCVDRCRWLQ